MGAAAVAVGVAGLALQAKGMIDARRDAKAIAAKQQAAANFAAAQMEQNAGQEQAAAQRTALVEARNTRMVQSRAIALAAASGASASDPTVMKIIGDISGEGSYRQNLALYEGEERARQLKIAATATRMSGDISAGATLAQGRSIALEGAGRLALGGSTLLSRYGYDSPATQTATGAIPSGSRTLDAGTPVSPVYG